MSAVTTQSKAPPGFLSEGFYKMHRDRLLEENAQLRDRILYLEGKLRLVASHLDRACAEVKP